MSDLLFDFKNGVLVLTLNRPARANALTDDMIDDLHRRLVRANEDRAVRAILLTGAGNAFCTGYDLKQLLENQESLSKEQVEGRIRINLERTATIIRILYDGPKPSIAAINGVAAGGGLALALACDLRVCAANAKLSTAFAAIGASGDSGISYFLAHLAGPEVARRLCFSSEPFSPEQAREWGLLHEVTEASECLALAQAQASLLAAGPTSAIGRMKKNLNAAIAMDFEAALALEHTNMNASLQTHDHEEGLQAVIERRKPHFSGA